MCLMCDAMSRRDFLRLSTLLSAGAALPLVMQQQARAAAEPDAPVRVGYLPITDAAPARSYAAARAGPMPLAPPLMRATLPPNRAVVING